MKRTLSFFVFLSFLLCASMVVMVQNVPSIPEKAESIVKNKNPHWKLVQKQERGRQVNLLFGPSKADAVLTVFTGATTQAAADKMKALDPGSGCNLADAKCPSDRIMRRKIDAVLFLSQIDGDFNYLVCSSLYNAKLH